MEAAFQEFLPRNRGAFFLKEDVRWWNNRTTIPWNKDRMHRRLINDCVVGQGMDLEKIVHATGQYSNYLVVITNASRP